MLLGDIIDRGPDSAALIERIMAFARSTPDLVVLRGNHEDIMTEALQERDEEMFASWLTFGGDATLRSWGIDDAVIEGPIGDLMAAARKAIPTATLRWISRLPLSYQSGSVFFTHAGIRPGVALKRQQANDLLWIGDEFLQSDDEHPAVIVHGHSIVEDGPEIRDNRIALDTGAFRTGRLSSIGFEDDRQWILST